MGRLADDDAARALAHGGVDDRLGRLLAADSERLPAQALGEAEMLADPPTSSRIEMQRSRGLGVHREPGRTGRVGHAFCGPDQAGRGRTRTDGDEDAFGQLPPGCQPTRQLTGLDPSCDVAQGQFTQSGEIVGCEETSQRPPGAVTKIDLAGPQALQQNFGRQIDKFDGIGTIKEAIGHPFTDLDPGEPGHWFAQTLDVLDIERGQNVDAGIKQVFGVLPTFGVTAARGIAVGELIEDQDRRPPPQGSDHIEFH